MICTGEVFKTLNVIYYRALRDQWELVCDQLSDTQRKLESCLIQWSSYDENYEQLQKWLLDTEIQLKEDTDMKGTLPDKKAQLQNHRVRKKLLSFGCGPIAYIFSYRYKNRG